MRIIKLKINLALWKDLISELKARGMGAKESGAFLLGDKNSNTIIEYICYEDLDPHVSDTGIIEFNGAGYIQLWEYCSKSGVQVLADVHTHPYKWIGQSSSDKRNPMIPQTGHIAFIVPFFATKEKQEFKGVGVYKYLGNFKWRDYSIRKKAILEIKK